MGMEPNLQGLERLVQAVKTLPRTPPAYHLRKAAGALARKRYSVLTALNPKETVFLVDGTSVPGHSAPYAVVKYLPYNTRGGAELQYTQKYSGWVGPTLYFSEALPQCVEMVMEAANSSLRPHLPLHTTEEQLSVAHGVAELVSVLEAEGEGHYDLKPENVLVFRSGTEEAITLRLADFGLTRTREQFQALMKEKKHRMGTYGYIGPEFFRPTTSCSHSVPDIYAFGVFLYEIIKGDLPPGFKVDDNVAHFSVMQSKEYHRELLTSPMGKAPPVFQELIYTCTEEDPRMRPKSFKEILAALNRAA